MPAAPATERGFTLADFDIPNPPADQTPKGPDNVPAQEAPPKVAQDDPPVPPLVDDINPPPPAAAAEGAPKTLSDLMDAAGDFGAREAEKQQKAEAEKKAAEDAEKARVAAAAVATPPAPDTTQRDADLKIPEDKHITPRTRALWKERDAKIVEARNARDQLTKERDELSLKLKAAEEKAATPVIPDDMKNELASYRERVRELDASRDPAIQAKYDKKIEANSARAIAILEKQGLFTVTIEEGKTRAMTQAEKDARLAAVKANGLNLRGLAKYVKALETGDQIEDAEDLRDLARENTRLAADKEAEIATIKADYEGRKTTRTAEQKQRVEQTAARIQQHGQSFLKADLDELAKSFPWIQPPAGPLVTDAPAIAKAKQDAVDAYTAAGKAIETGINQFNAQGVTPDKALEAQGRLNAAAIKSLVLQTHVIPRLTKEFAAATARVKELEGELEKIRGAGRLSRSQAQAPSESNNGEKFANLEQAFLSHRPGGGV